MTRCRNPIIVLSLDSLGDIVLRQPFLKALLDLDNQVTLVVRETYATLVPYLDHRLDWISTSIHPYLPPNDSTWVEADKLRGAVADKGPDILVCALFNRTYLDEWLFLQFPKLSTFGFENPRLRDWQLKPYRPELVNAISWDEVVTSSVPCLELSAEVAKYSPLYEAITGEPLNPRAPCLHPGKREQADAERILAGLGWNLGSYALGCPAGTQNIALKRWPLDPFADLLLYLERKHGLPTLLTGIEMERPFLHEVAETVKARGGRAVEWIGTPASFGTLLGLIGGSRLYLGSDTGTMHLAAALERPVVALFGGGNWPRFVPNARRTFVACQPLPCFGCYWNCGLAAPLCIHRVDMEQFKPAVDWILSDSPDEVRIQAPQPSHELLEEVIHSGIRRIQQERRYLLEVEADREARLVVIHRYQEEISQWQHWLEGTRQQLEQEISGRAEAEAAMRAAKARLYEVTQELGSERARYEQVILELEQRKARLYEVTQELGSERARYEQVILELEQRVALLSTTGAALRRLVKVIATPLGLLGFLRRHRSKAEHYLRKWKIWVQSRQVDRSTTGEEAPVVTQRLALETNTLINFPLVEAFAAARSAGSGASDHCLEACFQLGKRWRRVLCLHPAEIDLQAAYMMARAGAQVECVGCDPPSAMLTCPNLMIWTIPFLAWLKEQPGGILADYDGLFLGGRMDEPVWRHLTGRFSISAELFTNSVHVAQMEEWKLPGPQAETPEGYLLYSELPFAWRLPPPAKELLAISGDWPWSDDPLPDFPDRNPSGRPWPRVSVITVTQNQGQFIEETLRSVLRQGYPNLEYIVLDRRSTDETSGTLGRYKAKLAQCKSELDDGQGDALNKGLRRATGEIMAWLNSDGQYLPWTLLRVALAFDQFPDADLVVGGCALVLQGEKAPHITHHTSMPLGQVVPLPVDRLLDIDGSWQKGVFFYQPGVFWKREIWQKAGNRVDTSLYYGTAYELWVRLAFNGARILHVPDTLAMVREHPNQRKAGEDLPFLQELRQVNARLKKEWGRT